MKPTDSRIVDALRREAAADRVQAPASFDFTVMRALRDTAPPLPGNIIRSERFNIAFVASAAACLMLGAVLGARTMGRQLDTLRAAGESIGDVAETAERLAHSVRPPSFPDVPRLLS